ncbi:MAG: DUF421 domain-containing protein [Chitinophagales bacterium]|nr:DUF421 domain-containing protein [Chitinophagales bacterium]
MEIIQTVFGIGEHLSFYQMGARAFVVFFITLFLIRLAGMRTIGKKSAFDTALTIMLGALLSRIIVGASEFIPTVCAGTVIALIHRLLAWISMGSETIEKIIKGEQRTLYQQGHIQWKNMRRACVSENDLMESVRLKANVASLNEIEEAHIESNGEISVVLKR